jgi:hypothetical protein
MFVHIRWLIVSSSTVSRDLFDEAPTIERIGADVGPNVLDECQRQTEGKRPLAGMLGVCSQCFHPRLSARQNKAKLQGDKIAPKIREYAY